MIWPFPSLELVHVGPAENASQVWLVIGAAQRALTRNGVANYSS